MRLYVSSNAIRDLNKMHGTKIYDKHGNYLGGDLVLVNGKPVIRGLFGSGESIYLDSLKLDNNTETLDVSVTTHGNRQVFYFDMLDESEEETLITEWKA